METTAMPSMKPVLITQVSDDIRALRGTDVSQQQTALSARAINDVFAGDLVSQTNASDDKYFVKSGADEGKIDVNLLVDSGCRYIPQNSIINGPEHATTDSSSSGDPLGGFMYTLAVLPSGELLWGTEPRGTANNGISYDAAVAPQATRTALADKSIIRQVFWVHTVDEFGDASSDVLAYTRIGQYKSATGLYVWSNWTLLGGEMLYIIVTDPSQQEIVTPMVNATYSVHCNVSNFILPDAATYKYGTKIRILQYPDPDISDRGAWFTRVTYTALDEDKGINEDFELLCTPSPNRNTAKKEEAYLEDLSPTCYEFSVIPLLDETKAVIGRTWQLDVNAEETEFTAGLTELLGAHTDPGVNDFVDYLNMRYREESTAYSQSSTSTIVFNRAMPCTGYVNGKITKLSSELADNWTVVVEAVAATTDADFVKVDTSITRYPSDSVLYFNKRTITEAGITRDVYEMAIDSSGDYEPGHLNSGVQFPSGKDYYTLSASAYHETICTIKGSDLQEGQEYVFHKYFNRHNIIYTSIKPTTYQSHITVRNKKYANVQIGVTPDPHRGAYLAKQNLNRSAYTEFQFLRLKERNEFCTDLIDIDGHTATPEEVPASTKAVINAHNNIANRLQAKGLLTGIVDYGNMSGGALDELFDTGIYRVMPYSETSTLSPSINNNEGWPEGTVLSRYADVIVLGKTVAAPTAIHEEWQYIPTEDEEPVSATVYYIWQKSEARFVLAENNGHPEIFQNVNKPYYVKTGMTYIASSDYTFQSGKQYYRYNAVDGTYTPTTVTPGNKIPQPNTTYFEKVNVGIRDSDEVTQIVYQCGDNGMNMWYRHKISARTWSRWMNNTPHAVRFVQEGYTAINLTTAEGLQMVNSGIAHIRCGSSVGTSVKVTLPEPSQVTMETVIKFEFTGISTSIIKFVYGTATESSPSFQHTFTGASGDLNTITCKSDGSTWYFQQENWAKALNS